MRWKKRKCLLHLMHLSAQLPLYSIKLLQLTATTIVRKSIKIQAPHQSFAEFTLDKVIIFKITTQTR